MGVSMTPKRMRRLKLLSTWYYYNNSLVSMTPKRMRRLKPVQRIAITMKAGGFNDSEKDEKTETYYFSIGVSI